MSHASPRFSLLSTLLLTAALVPGCAAPEGAFRYPPLSPEALRHHVEVLSADGMRGREAGTREALAAADYIASVLTEAGWARAGNQGTHLQHIGMAGWRTEGDASYELAGPAGATRVAVNGVDLTWLRGPPAHASLSVQVVMSADELPAVADRQGALVLAADGRTAMDWLGASRGQGWGAVLFQGPASEGTASEAPELLVGGSDDPVLLMMRGSLAAELTSGAWNTLHLGLKAGDPVPLVNVVGLLPGRGETDEVIVLSAHYDHIGMASEGEDRVFNGADDDASGVAVVLELARALAAGPPPERSVIALLVTGEERGLLGSRGYVSGPPVPLKDTVANLNFEMLGRPDELAGGKGRLWLTGWERTNLGEALVAAGLPLVPDPRPEQGFFGRSDNMSFAQAGIPAQSLSSFGLHADYHRVTDEAHTLDYEHLAICAHGAMAAVHLIASGKLTPQWLPGGNPAER